MTELSKKQEVFEFNGGFYSVSIDPQESREMYIERVWYILKKIENNPDLEIGKIILQSRCWSNSKHLGCLYEN